VDSLPIIKDNRTSFIFRTKEIQLDNLKYNCCGNILVYIKGKTDFCYADNLILRGKLCRPFGSYLYGMGIYSIMRVYSNTAVIRLNKKGGLLVLRFALWLKQALEKIIYERVSCVPASILDAMVLGEKRNINPFIYNSMVKSGTVHILVVSGFNVGIVTFLIILFLKLIRIPKRIRFFIALPLIIIYCLMTGASTPVVRAAVMAIVFMLAYLIKREADIYNSCAVAMIFILGINPRQLFDISFQLSFSSVISIVFLYPKVKSFLSPQALLKIKYIRYLIDGCLVSLSAWLGTMGFIAYYFKIFSPVTVLANLFIVPLATLITLCGFSLIIISLILPPAATFFASTCELLIKLLVSINTFLLNFPGAYIHLS
jgi:competence protein ComEC